MAAFPYNPTPSLWPLGSSKTLLGPELPMIPWAGAGGVIISHFRRSLDSLQDSAPTLALDARARACAVGPVAMAIGDPTSVCT